MRKIWCLILLSGSLYVLINCTNGSSGTPDEWYDVRDSLVSKPWERSFHNEAAYGEEENDVQEIWLFESNGKGSRESIITYKDGKEKKNRYSFPWRLTIDLVINIDDDRYWKIEEITSTRLYIYETSKDPIKEPGQDRTYYEYNYTKEGI